MQLLRLNHLNEEEKVNVTRLTRLANVTRLETRNDSTCQEIS